MTIYTAKITAAKNSTAEHELEIEGYAITQLSVLFPSGCLGLVSVRFLYGIKQIFPYDESQDIRGNGETVSWSEFWKLPEEKTTIKIRVENEDDTYSHTIYARIVVKKRAEMLAQQIASAFMSVLKRLFGYVS